MEKDNELARRYTSSAARRLAKKIMGTSWTDVGKPRYLVDRDTEGKDWVLVKQDWHGHSEVIGRYKRKKEAEVMRNLAEFSE